MTESPAEILFSRPLDISCPNSRQDDAGGMCRICASTSCELVSVFDPKAQEVQLVEKIHSYLPIMITDTDILPQTVCESCVQRLESCHNLVLTCLQADAALREIYGFGEDHEEGDYLLSPLTSEPLKHEDDIVKDQLICEDRSYLHIHQQTEAFVFQSTASGSPDSEVNLTDFDDTNCLTVVPYLDDQQNTDPCRLAQGVMELLKTNPCVQMVDTSTDSIMESSYLRNEVENVQVRQKFSLSKNRKSKILSSPSVQAALSQMKLNSKVKNPKFKVYRVRLANAEHLPIQARVSRAINVLKRANPLLSKREDVCPVCNCIIRNDIKKYRAHIETHLQTSTPFIDPFDEALNKMEGEVLKHITYYEGSWEMDSSLLPPDSELNKLLEEQSTVKFSSLNSEQQQEVINKLLGIVGDEADLDATKHETNEQPCIPEIHQSSTMSLSHTENDSDAACGTVEPLEESTTCYSGDVEEHIVNTEQLEVEENSGQTENLLKDIDGLYKSDTGIKDMIERDASFEAHDFGDKNNISVSPDSTDMVGPVVCELCGKLVSSYRKLLAHKQMHGALKCRFCGKEFMKKNHFDRHITKHNGQKKHVCQYCGLIFHLQDSLRNHEKSHMSSLTCDHCGRSFSKEKFLQEHRCYATVKAEQDTYICGKCPRTFVQKEFLRKHEESHVENVHLCETCGKSFRNSMYLRKHREIHLDQRERASKRVPCNLCDKTFQNLHKLRMHMHKHKGERPFACEVCGKAFSCKQTVRQHLATHGEAKYPCPLCGKLFNRKGNLQTHINRHTRNAHNGMPYTCRICGEKFSDRGRYTAHCITHSALQRSQQTTDPTPCKECGKMFTNKHILNLHLRREHGVGAKACGVYCCQMCSSTFTTTRSLKFHEYSHGLKPDFQCKICFKVFLTGGSLESHERLHRGEKPFACTTCSRRFSSQHSLYQHSRNVHVIDPPHKCDICGNKFKRAAALRIHQSTHSDERPFECDVCGSTFKTKGDRYTHRKRHPDAPPLPARSYVVKPVHLACTCSVCGMVFETLEDCNVHIEETHPFESEEQSKDFSEIQSAVNIIEQSAVVDQNPILESTDHTEMDHQTNSDQISMEQQGNCILIKIIAQS